MGTVNGLSNPNGLKGLTLQLTGMRKRGLFEHLAETFQVLGDFSRVQIVWALGNRELNVGELVSVTGMSQPAVSHHLRTLRNLRLVRVRREGRTSFYSLDDHHINGLLQEGIDHVEDLIK